MDTPRIPDSSRMQNDRAMKCVMYGETSATWIGASNTSNDAGDKEAQLLRMRCCIGALRAGPLQGQRQPKNQSQTAAERALPAA